MEEEEEDKEEEDTEVEGEEEDGTWRRVTASFPVCGSDTRGAGCVIDGDTVLLGEAPRQRRIRLTGFDAPELDSTCRGRRWH